MNGNDSDVSNSLKTKRSHLLIALARPISGRRATMGRMQ